MEGYLPFINLSIYDHSPVVIFTIQIFEVIFINTPIPPLFMDPFQQEKKEALSKDKSKKGSVDELMKPILDKINLLPDYYTASSCSGRIMLSRYGSRKDETEWLFVSHDFIGELPLDNLPLKESQLRNNQRKEGKGIKNNLLNKSIKSFSSKNNKIKNDNDDIIWLKVEPMIIHVCCKNIESANKFLMLSRRLFRRAGIISIKNKVSIEIMGSERVEMPLVRDGELLVSEDALRFILVEVNKKLERAHRRINDFLRVLREL